MRDETKVRRTWNPAGDKGPSEDLVVLASRYSFASVLDLGCGTGRNLLPFDRAGTSLVGVDVDARQVTRARRSLSSCSASLRLHVADVRTVTVDRQFSLVICYGVLHFLPRDERLRVYERIRSWVEVGGVAALVAFNAAVPIPDDLRPLIPEPPRDSSELCRAFADWTTIRGASYVYSDEHDDGRIRHTHSIDRLIVRKGPRL